MSTRITITYCTFICLFQVTPRSHGSSDSLHLSASVNSSGQQSTRSHHGVRLEPLRPEMVCDLVRDLHAWYPRSGGLQYNYGFPMGLTLMIGSQNHNPHVA